ncbi:prepilin-type N-terminal cleavage/methylation domain-containing protein [uncultured Candidatus Pelagibacter sp.]|jgi:prepilin-type N-terminal cleavage/methylation domain-containing protein|uniref:pilus assembly FimT family protein n=1 Tax=uncultured Candidatus Pelagibacter sp. TaxID=372654 RepID=UPI0026185EB3|nr:prepilin-type N-terminal cleavage/methylation domain-containing protein [uncultured Candidatus Pelagibacter sp.]
MQLISNKKGFTILELLVVLAVMGVFTAIAYPNISSWITDREVKKEVYETVAFIKERKAEVTSGKYGMTQIVLKPNLEVYTMSPQNFFNTYQNISSSSSYKTNKQCDYAWRQSGFSRNSSLETLSFPINVSEVQVYPNGAHNPSATYLCITKDASIKFMQLRKTDRDPDTNQNVDMFVFCSNSNTTQSTCKFDANYDFMYKLNIDNFQNIKVYKKNKKKNSWIKIDG